MIPQRVFVRGLLCYRDPQEVCFDGASLWMLAGPNGSGKSALFDAVTYALFGHHRAGKQNARDLINKNKKNDGLEIEFDFLLDDRLYQARRTLQPTGKPTRQLRLWNPAAGTAGEGAWEEVPDSESEEGFDNWVREHVGLTYETFTSSVLLLQGKAEKLLDAKPEGRREVLAGVVGLKRYEELHELVNDERKRLKDQAEGFQGQLNELPKVGNAELKGAEARVKLAQGALSQAQKEGERLQALALALSLLGRLYRERENMREANKRCAKARERESRAGETIEQLKSRHVRLVRQRTIAVQARESADRRVTQTETLFQGIHGRVNLFDDLAREKSCRYCGQALSAEHVRGERGRLRNESATAGKAYRAAFKVRKAALRKERQLSGQLTRLGKQLQNARVGIREWRHEKINAACEARRASKECTQAYRELPEPFRSRVSPHLPEDWSATSYPTAKDLAGVRGKHGEFGPDQLRRQLEEVKQEQTTRAEELLQAKQEQKDLLTRRDQRLHLQKQYREVEEKHQLYRILAELLGPRGLQLYLLRHAERGIVEYANAMLDRLSAGQIYLRLRGEEDGEAAVGKALVLEQA
jgi:DNA repair exonuclease SbcCD ATPase subunit